MRTEKKQAYLSNENISVPLFKNKWLDSLTRTHIAIPVSMFFLYAIALLYYTKVATDLTTLQVTSLYLTGFLFFTFAEYMVHRFFGLGRYELFRQIHRRAESGQHRPSGYCR